MVAGYFWGRLFYRTTATPDSGTGKNQPVPAKICKKIHVPVIATNDSHYTDQEDYNAHDILLCINTGEKQSTPGFDDFVNDEVSSEKPSF